MTRPRLDTNNGYVMDTEPRTVDQLLDDLRQAGAKPPAELLTSIRDLGADAVPALLAMVTDPREYEIAEGDEDNRTGWAPYTAIEMLGEMHPPEALDPLLSLIDWDDYDYLPNVLPAALGQYGPQALVRLIPVLTDTTKTVWAQGYALDAMVQIAIGYPERRDEIVAVMVGQLDTDKPDNEDAYLLNAFLVDALTHLRAREALPSIIRGYEDDRVDTFYIGWQDVRGRLDLPTGTAPDLDTRYPERAPYIPHIPHIPPAWDTPFVAPGKSQAGVTLSLTQEPVSTYRRETSKVGRNDPCPCGSGKKYKKCCGR